LEKEKTRQFILDRKECLESVLCPFNWKPSSCEYECYIAFSKTEREVFRKDICACPCNILEDIEYVKTTFYRWLNG